MSEVKKDANTNASIKNYVKIARPDHWVKNAFIFPGLVLAFILVGNANSTGVFILKLIAGFLATCFIASANYVINEWLDAKFDRFHPTKKNRSVVTNDMSVKVVIVMYITLTLCGFVLGYITSFPFFCMVIWLWVMEFMLELLEITVCLNHLVQMICI